MSYFNSNSSVIINIMALEIERKFLVTSTEYKYLAKPVKYLQGYIAILSDKIVRVRIAGDKGYITFKVKVNDTTRKEYEYEVPFNDANSLLEEMCTAQKVEKLRYHIPHGGLIWEVDEFKGLNDGLVVAEIELTSEEQSFDKPSWIGDEVTNDPRYLNANLSIKPYNEW